MAIERDVATVGEAVVAGLELEPRANAVGAVERGLDPVRRTCRVAPIAGYKHALGMERGAEECALR